MTKEQSPKERWPERYSIRCQIWMPSGASLEYETDLTEKNAEVICAALDDQMKEIMKKSKKKA